MLKDQFLPVAVKIRDQVDASNHSRSLFVATKPQLILPTYFSARRLIFHHDSFPLSSLHHHPPSQAKSLEKEEEEYHAEMRRMQHKKDGAEIESDVPEVCARGGGFGGKYEERWV